MIKARIVGSVRRIPGLYDISGYKPAAYYSNSIIVSEKQMKYLLDTYLNQNPQAKKDFQELQ